MKLKKVKSVELVPTAPFAFDATFHKPAHFPSGDNFWQPGARWQTWYWQGKQLGLKFANLGSVNQPKIRVDIFHQKKLSNEFIKPLNKEVRYRYNLDLDLTDFYKQFSNDKILKPVIKRLKGMRPGHQNSLYEYLIIGIVLQNATVKRSISMLQALYENYGKLLEYDGKKLWCFWKPGGLKKAAENELRALKVGYRAKSIKRTDDYFVQNLINEFELRQKDKETQKEELLKLYGVGPATVWYLLFDVFHHYDFFDHISPWEQKIYSKLFFDQSPEKPVPVKKLLKCFERYSKYKQLAVHYIWDDLWWKRKNKHLPWLEKLIRI
ncbi:DNA-3-methyladenine glycosylase family protein [Patescibacteria group bacterium]